MAFHIRYGTNFSHSSYLFLPVHGTPSLRWGYKFIELIKVLNISCHFDAKDKKGLFSMIYLHLLSFFLPNDAKKDFIVFFPPEPEMIILSHFLKWKQNGFPPIGDLFIPLARFVYITSQIWKPSWGHDSCQRGGKNSVSNPIHRHVCFLQKKSLWKASRLSAHNTI